MQHLYRCKMGMRLYGMPDDSSSRVIQVSTASFRIVPARFLLTSRFAKKKIRRTNLTAEACGGLSSFVSVPIDCSSFQNVIGYEDNFQTLFAPSRRNARRNHLDDPTRDTQGAGHLKRK
jgi:hypothetical protein